MKRKSNKLVAGVGVNDADYPIVRFGETVNGRKKREWICPYYKTWSAMLNRCYRAAERSRCKYFKNLTEAISFRNECLLQRVESIVEKHPEFKNEALNYFNNRWEEEVVKYSGKLPI